ADSLCYGITIGKSGPGLWWHNAQCQLNEETFLSCNTNNNCHPVGALGNRLNATQFCEKQALTTAVPDVVQPSSMAIKHNISVLLVILMCLLLNLL
ncbi:hypothetical protein U0070_002953, partial [Myodes glareolus]